MSHSLLLPGSYDGDSNSATCYNIFPAGRLEADRSHGMHLNEEVHDVLVAHVSCPVVRAVACIVAGIDLQAIPQ